jgi:DNA-binding MarR family transcriptional regulator
MTTMPDHNFNAALDQDLGDAEYKAIGDFRRALREFLAFSDNAALQAGVTPQQHQALLAIRTHLGPEPMTIGELASCLMIRNHSAVGLVTRLVEHGLVERKESEDDRRRVLLKLLPSGADVLKRISLLNVGEYHRSADFLSHVLRRVRALNPETSKDDGTTASTTKLRSER